MKFLVIRFSSIGDIVLTTPVVRCLKRQVPDAEVHFLTKHAMRATVAANPYIDKIHLLDESLHAIIETLKAENFNYIIDLHYNLRTWRIKRALQQAQAFSFNKLNWEKWLLTRFKINRMPPLHIVDRYMETVKPFGVQNDGLGLDYFIAPNELIRSGTIPAGHSFGYIGLVIGASYTTKKMPVKMLQQLCSFINYPIILLGGPEDKAEGMAVAGIDPGKIYNACGKFALNESAALVKEAKLIISHDTGLMHIAAAYKKPVISVWGNTVPAFGMHPYYGELYEALQTQKPYRLFEVNGLSCRPCSKLGYSKCPKGHFKCMNLQDVEAMATEAIRQISK